MRVNKSRFITFKLRKMCLHYSEEHAHTDKSQIIKLIADRVFYVIIMPHRMKEIRRPFEASAN